jgi:hypothetical protein
VDIPVATGERIHDRIEFRELFESQAVDIIQPDVGHIGGIWETRKLAATAEAHYVLVAPHNVGGPVLTAASLQVGFSSPNFKILEHFNDFADAEIKKVVKGAPAGRRRLLPPLRRARSRRRAGHRRGGRIPAAAGPVRPVGGRLGAAQAEGREVSTAVVIEAPGEHRLAAHEPRQPDAGEALVRVHAVGICGSDREVYQGNRPEGYVRYPLTPGHEWSGTVEAVGAGVPSTLWSAARSSARASATARSATAVTRARQRCARRATRRPASPSPGRWPPPSPCPPGCCMSSRTTPTLTAAALLEPAACIAAAALKANARPGERVAVVGTGTLGMFAVQFLKAGSPAELLVVGTRPDREELSSSSAPRTSVPRTSPSRTTSTW